eukprot:844908-Pyramimonas_sp.AAC.1
MRGTHVDGTTGGFGGAPCGVSTGRVKMPNWAWGTHAGGPTGVELPMGPPNAALGFVKMQHWVWGAPAGGPIGDFGGAPYGATKRCTG